jgi:transcriptional regulator with XRE-family HTH domain
MKKRTLAPGLLREWREANNVTQNELARGVGGTSQQISNYENNRQRPALDMAFAIEQKTGVPMQAWCYRYRQQGRRNHD